VQPRCRAPRVVDRRVDDVPAVGENDAPAEVFSMTSGGLPRDEVAHAACSARRPPRRRRRAVELRRSRRRKCRARRTRDRRPRRCRRAGRPRPARRRRASGRRRPVVGAASGARQWMPYCLPSTVRP
jgi:hypothetical protein